MSPYDIYDYRDTEPEELLTEFSRPFNSTYAAFSGGDLIGFRSFGVDGRVPGGIYDEDYLDTGGGMKPELTGLGIGEEWLRSGLKFGSTTFTTNRFRVTVAQFNKRAIKVCYRAGFLETLRFNRPTDNEPFIVMTIDRQ